MSIDWDVVEAFDGSVENKDCTLFEITSKIAVALATGDLSHLSEVAESNETMTAVEWVNHWRNNSATCNKMQEELEVVVSKMSMC